MTKEKIAIALSDFRAFITQYQQVFTLIDFDYKSSIDNRKIRVVQSNRKREFEIKSFLSTERHFVKFREGYKKTTMDVKKMIKALVKWSKDTMFYLATELNKILMRLEEIRVWHKILLNGKCTWFSYLYELFMSVYIEFNKCTKNPVYNCKNNCIIFVK